MITMKSKSDADMILDMISQDVRVANKIFMDNAPEQTVYNTDKGVNNGRPHHQDTLSMEKSVRKCN